MFENINAQSFQHKTEDTENTVILDVRTPQEYQEGHIPGAVNINIQDPDFMDELDELAPDKTYLVYCRSGVRSAKACQMMGSQGFEKLYNLDGGILEWTGNVE